MLSYVVRNLLGNLLTCISVGNLDGNSPDWLFRITAVGGKIPNFNDENSLQIDNWPSK